MATNRVGPRRVLASAPALALAVMVALGGFAPGVAQARSHHSRSWTRGTGVVRCVAARSQSSRRMERSGGLPTDRAVFFARSGNRCLWHHGALGRG